MYRILIVGAGYAGSAVAQYFCHQKQRVWTLVQTPEKQAALKAMGAMPVLADLTKPETLEGIPPAHFVLLSAAPRERTTAAYEALYLKGIENCLQRIRNQIHPLLILYLSSTSVYGDQQGVWVDENSALKPDSDQARILIEAERQVLGCGMPSAILRLGGIYGPGRNRLAAVQNSDWKPPAEDAYMNMIHVEDIVQAVALLFKKAEAGNVYLGCDGQPPKRSEFYAWLCEQLGKSWKPSLGRQAGLRGKRCRNDRLCALGQSFHYPSFREGYSALMAVTESKQAGKEI